MARFVFRLESVLTYRRGLRDQAQRVLAQLLQQDEAIRRNASEVEGRRGEQLSELRAILGGGAVDVDRAAMRRYHAGVLSLELQSIEQQRLQLAENLKKCRELLAKAEQEVRLLEKLREKQLAEFLHEEERRAGRDREEAWLGAHWAEFSE